MRTSRVFWTHLTKSFFLAAEYSNGSPSYEFQSDLADAASDPTLLRTDKLQKTQHWAQILAGEAESESKTWIQGNFSLRNLAELNLHRRCISSNNEVDQAGFKDKFHSQAISFLIRPKSKFALNSRLTASPYATFGMNSTEADEFSLGEASYSTAEALF